MNAPLSQPITPEQRKQLEELYRQQVSAVRTLAKMLGYPCPIVSREERRGATVRPIDVCAILNADS